MKFLNLIFICFFSGSCMAQVSLIQDIATGSYDSNPTMLTDYNNMLFMAAETPAYGNELWFYDGTSVQMTLDVYPGAGSTFQLIFNQHGAVANSKLYLPAKDSPTGIELYQYDGSLLTLAYELTPGTNGSQVRNLFSHNNKIYFTASVSGAFRQLFKYDPVQQTCKQLTNVIPGSIIAPPTQPFLFNNKIFFTMGQDVSDLYAYDPALDTTTQITHFSHTAHGFSGQPSFAIANNLLYFGAADSNYGYELYRYDPVGNIVTRLTDLNAGAENGISPDNRSIEAYNGTIYFSGAASAANFQLYAYDPVSNTTNLVSTVNPGGNAHPVNFTRFNNALYFVADDGMHGNEIWKSTGSSTAMLLDLNAGVNGSDAAELMVWNNALFFNATNGASGYELFRYDETNGIADVRNGAKQLLVYPNPVAEKLMVSVDPKTTGSIEIEIRNTSGSLVFTGRWTHVTGHEQIEINTRALSAGRYVLSVKNMNGMIANTSFEKR